MSTIQIWRFEKNIYSLFISNVLIILAKQWMDTCSINNRRIKVLASFKCGAFAFLFEKARLVRSAVICICVTKGGAIQMTTVEDLYYGSTAPYERYIRHGSREEKVLKLLCRNEESLTKNLNNRQKEIFNKFTDC